MSATRPQTSGPNQVIPATSPSKWPLMRPQSVWRRREPFPVSLMMPILLQWTSTLPKLSRLLQRCWWYLERPAGAWLEEQPTLIFQAELGTVGALSLPT